MNLQIEVVEHKKNGLLVLFITLGLTRYSFVVKSLKDAVRKVDEFLSAQQPMICIPGDQ